MKKDKLSKLFGRFNPRDVKYVTINPTIPNETCKGTPNGVETLKAGDPCTVEDTNGFADPGDSGCDVWFAYSASK